MRDEDGQVKWGVVLGGIIVSAIVGLTTMVISFGRDVAALAARQYALSERVDRIDNGISQATADRYRASDAQRDFGRVEQQMLRLEARIERHEQAQGVRK